MTVGMKIGNLACLKADITDGSFTNSVGNMNSLEAEIDKDQLETTVLCGAGASAFTTSANGITKTVYTGDGYWDDYGDAGQAMVLDNVAHGADLWLKFFHDDGANHYVKSQAQVESFEIKTTPKGTVDVSFKAQSTGTISSA